MTDWNVKPHLLPSVEKERLEAVVTQELLARSEIAFAYLHGSFEKGGPFRDLDLAVYVRADMLCGVPFREYEGDLSVALTGRVRLPIDVRVLNDAPVAFRYHALKGRALVVRDDEIHDEFCARTWDDYCDFAPSARRYLREVLGA